MSNLKAYRVKNGYSQSEIGRKLGLTVSGYQKIESGVNQISADKLEILSKLYDVSMDKLAGTEPVPNADKEKAAEQFSKAYGLSKADMEAVLRFVEAPRRDRAVLVKFLNKHLD